MLCGGTGAHVALALVRLHALGQALGFFRGPADAQLSFPALYLVDQDFGDGDRDEPTAWQEARRLVAAHPGRHDWREATGRAEPPEMKIVTPLPVGAGRTWFDPPYDTLGRRFADSPWLDLLTSAAQREIRFSHGMMGSPAVGSLLFRLKDFDTKPGGAGTNHDGAYQELLTARGRVAVVGSAIGGTGASVAPTLAQRFADAGADVMAVMVLNWFRFPAEGLDEEKLEKAQRRNRAMDQNAHSAFAYYGKTLARRVATVPVGMPDTAVEDRRYTSDTQQPIRESFIHGVAALCSLHHFLRRDPCSPGLYQMGAEDPACLGGGNRLPGHAGEDTVQSLADQAATLAETLDIFQKTLSAPPGGGWFGVSAAIREAAAGLAAPAQVAQAVRKLVDDYRGHLKWMDKVLRVRPKPDDKLPLEALTREARSRERLAQDTLRQPTDRADVSPEDAALALFHWTARWIRDFAAGDGRAVLITPPAGSAQGGYWPPLEGHDALNVAAEKAGALTQVPDQNIDGTVEGFILGENVAQNGWPDPVAAAGHFRYAVEHEHPTELRQLEMLLAGVVMGELTLRDVPPRKNPPPLSLDHLVDEYREDEKRLPGFARVALVHEHRGGDVVLGFNAPHTLLCPTPTADDEKRESAWGALWQALTGSSRPRDWRTEDRDWRYAGAAVRQIRAWIENEKRAHGGAPPPWTHVFEHRADPASASYGRGPTLSVYWGAGDEAARVDVALPTARAGDYWPDEDTPRIDDDALLAQAPTILELRTNAGVTFERVQFERPGRDKPIWGFWREHLELLQRDGVVAAFGSKPDAHQIAFLTADRRSAAILENVVILDRDDMMVRECTPMWQEPVPGSSAKSGPRYPDYPLRADYLGLVETDDGRRVVDLLKRGERVDAPRPSIDEGSRRRTRRGESTPSAGRSLSNAPKAAGKLVSRMVANAPKAARTLTSRVADGITEAVRDLQGGEDRVSTGRREIDSPRRRQPANDVSSVGDEPHGEPAKATWNLRLAGRGDPLPITLPVSAPDDEDEHHRAHWMVWPRFRSRESPFWRAYYVYQHCTYAKLGLSTLWFDPDDDRVHRCEAPSRAGSHPIRFDAGRRAHTGGPPVAFTLENTESGHELGLYLINLDPLSRRRDDVKVGLDFGTSHTVASVRADGKNHLVELPPELASRMADRLTSHVSENWSHVNDSKEGVKALGVWLPTYTDEPVLEETAGLLPSELLTIKPLANLSGKDPSQWQPGGDCVIPFMDMRRRDLADHLLSDFKWTVSDPAFVHQERALREVYLGMAIELVMADVVRRLSMLPERVDFTFTYPLRDSPDQVRDYQRTLRQVTESGTRSLGCELGLTDDVGIYNESSAAQGGTRVFGEVCLVGDLGGGTLDLFISAYGGPGVDFEEVADSAKLGGNELLRTMAEHPDLFLPRGSGWADRPGDVQTQLRAWMRSKGSARLFGGRRAGEAERHAGLNLKGFARPAEANALRALIERYFQLIVEYMARSLVAYLVRHWYPLVLENRPGDLDKLRVFVQLRGNGWRLWHGTEKYHHIEGKIAERIQARAEELWRERAGDRDPWRDMGDRWRKRGQWNDAGGDGTAGDGAAVGDSAARPPVDPPACSSEESHDANPKAAPILRVVGQAQRHDEIRCYSHALVELALSGHGSAQEHEPATIHWFDRLPVRTGGEGVQVEFREIRPPFLLSHPEARVRRELPDLERRLKRKINDELKEQGIVDGVEFKAPIAALVWEAAFESSRFVKGE